MNPKVFDLRKNLSVGQIFTIEIDKFYLTSSAGFKMSSAKYAAKLTTQTT